MTFWAVVVLGIVQGLTEFLPVSSSGHLVLLSRLFGIEDSLFVSIILHLATLLSVAIALRKEVWQIVRHPFGEQSKKLVVATLPTCLIVLLLYPLFTEAFEGGALPICFMTTAVLLFVTELLQKKSPRYSQTSQQNISYKQALVMGIGQGLATFPGISRSGTTICSGVLAGGERENVAKFSFLMSIPVILLSMALEIFKLATGAAFPQVNIPGLILAFLLAFVIGLLSVKAMIRLTQNLSFRWFSAYLVALAVLSFLI